MDAILGTGVRRLSEFTPECDPAPEADPAAPAIPDAFWSEPTLLGDRRSARGTPASLAVREEDLNLMTVALLLDRQNPFVQVRLPEPPCDTAPVSVLPNGLDVLPGGVVSDVQIGTDDEGSLIDDGGEEGSDDFVEETLADVLEGVDR